jgi:hypothetical protein
MPTSSARASACLIAAHGEVYRVRKPQCKDILLFLVQCVREKPCRSYGRAVPLAHGSCLPSVAWETGFPTTLLSASSHGILIGCASALIQVSRRVCLQNLFFCYMLLEPQPSSMVRPKRHRQNDRTTSGMTSCPFLRSQ